MGFTVLAFRDAWGLGCFRSEIESLGFGLRSRLGCSGLNWWLGFKTFQGSKSLKNPVIKLRHILQDQATATHTYGYINTYRSFSNIDMYEFWCVSMCVCE